MNLIQVEPPYDENTEIKVYKHQTVRPAKGNPYKTDQSKTLKAHFVMYTKMYPGELNI